MIEAEKRTGQIIFEEVPLKNPNYIAINCRTCSYGRHIGTFSKEFMESEMGQVEINQEKEDHILEYHK